MRFFGILGIILKMERVYFFYILPKLLLRIIHFKNLIQLYIIFYQFDASTKIKSQNINITSTNGYVFNTGTPISAVYTGNENTNYAIVTFSNIIMIRGFGSLGSSTTGPVRVYYI